MIRTIAVPILLLALAVSLPAEEIRGKVVSIADGDTITVLDAEKVQHRVRLEGMAKKGRWADKSPEPPWEFRKNWKK